MRLLFVLLMIACAGLLWATFAAAQHVRRARRRRRGVPRPQPPTAPPSIPSSFERPGTGSPAPAVLRSKQLQMHF